MGHTRRDRGRTVRIGSQAPDPVVATPPVLMGLDHGGQRRAGGVGQGTARQLQRCEGRQIFKGEHQLLKSGVSQEAVLQRQALQCPMVLDGCAHVRHGVFGEADTGQLEGYELQEQPANRKETGRSQQSPRKWGYQQAFIPSHRRGQKRGEQRPTPPPAPQNHFPLTSKSGLGQIKIESVSLCETNQPKAPHLFPFKQLCIAAD